MRNRISGVVFATTLLLSHVSFAARIESSGSAVVYNNDLEDARYRATEHAIKQAVLQTHTVIRSNDIVRDGEISSTTRLQSSGLAQDTRILQENLQNNILTVTIETEITPESQCSNGATNLYRKSVGITGFDLQKPQQANLGALHDIPRALPRSLTDEINQQGHLRALAATNLHIYPDLINAPSSTNLDGSLTDIAKIGENLGVQYVISGVIRDIGEQHPQHPDQKTPLNRLFSWANKQDGQRNLNVDVYIYDGFSGALIFENSYSEIGNWDRPERDKVGFGSATYWQTNYGAVTQQVLWQAALDASSQLRCQPFVANIFRTEGNKIHINAGSLAGIQKDDKFSVYRRYEIFDQLQTAQTQLNNANISVTITQVQPNFSIGELAVDARILNVQQQDVVIAW